MINFSMSMLANLKHPFVPGVVVAHSSRFSKRYIGSPSLVVLSDTTYLATHDFFGERSNEFFRPETRAYVTTDKGAHWQLQSCIAGAFWSKLFTHQNRLYLLGTDKHHGNLVIRSSTDIGVSWTDPTDSRTGLLAQGQFHCAPSPVVIHQNRLWRAIEKADGPIREWGKRYGSCMLSAPVDADLLNADSWQFSNTLYFDASYQQGTFGGWLEGQMLQTKEGTLQMILRVENDSSLNEFYAVIAVDTNQHTISFNPETGFVTFPGGSKKFVITYDAVSDLYLSMSNVIPQSALRSFTGHQPDCIRNTLALTSSPDLQTWNVRQVVLQHNDHQRHGYQYPSWQIVDNDIVFLSRTAHLDWYGGARNFHDANYLTFHRVKNFRSIF